MNRHNINIIITITLECDKIQPSTGHFQCDSRNFAAESTCNFKCPLGTLPGNSRQMICKATLDASTNITSYNWNKDASKFECVPTIRYVLEGHRLVFIELLNFIQ